MKEEIGWRFTGLSLPDDNGLLDGRGDEKLQTVSNTLKLPIELSYDFKFDFSGKELILEGAFVSDTADFYWAISLPNGEISFKVLKEW